MNLSDSNNNSLGIEIKKINLLYLSKNKTKSFSKKNIFSNNETPIFNKMPFLLKRSSNKNTSLFKTRFKKKLTILLKGNNTRKNSTNMSGFLSNELSENKTKNEKINKSNTEMKNKFYIRNREGLKCESESENVINLLSDSPSCQYFLSKNNKSLLKNRNKKDNIKNIFKKLKKNKTKLIMPNLNNMTPKNEQIEKSEIISDKNENKYNLKNIKIKHKFRNISVKNYEMMKQIFRKNIKKRSKIFIRSLLNLQNDSFPYDPICKRESQSNIKYNIFYNKNNLERIIKVEKINKKGFDEDDLLDDYYNIKRYNDNPEFVLKKLKQTFVPRAVKLNNFFHSTLIKYNNLHRSNFGYPS